MQAPSDDEETDAFRKKRIAIYHWMLGAKYLNAASAMSFAEAYHTGKRKGGQPEFSHQVAIASWVRIAVSDLIYPEETLVVAFLHDVREDYGVADEEIRGRWGDLVADAVDAMTKSFRGSTHDPEVVFATIANDPVASVVKLGDRIHNQGTMLGAFTREKIVAYLAETEQYFYPMCKVARRRFVRQEAVYEGAKLMLQSQVELLNAVLSASEA